MSYARPILSDATHVRLLASLPGYGQAGELIRRVDPMWGRTRDFLGEKPVWTVTVAKGEEACPHCGCDCNSDYTSEEIEVEASSEASAKRKAEAVMAANEQKYGGFEIDDVDPPKVPRIPITEEIEAMFEARGSIPLEGSPRG